MVQLSRPTHGHRLRGSSDVYIEDYFCRQIEYGPLHDTIALRAETVYLELSGGGFLGTLFGVERGFQSGAFGMKYLEDVVGHWGGSGRYPVSRGYNDIISLLPELAVTVIMDALPSPPASTQVLANPDLLHGIFTFVPLASANRNSHLALAGCTTVCCTFYEPAIRVLWRNLHTLLPLWHLLAPSNAPYPFRHSYVGGSGGILLDYLQKVNSAQLYLDPKRWDRFLWHATHVRGIVHRSHTWETICDADRLLTEAVITHNGGNTILPLLRTAQWDCIFPPQYDALTPFFTSTLRHATFDFVTPSDEAALVLVFRRLRESSPLLEKVVVYTGQVFDTVTDLLLMHELACFSRLHQVQISRIQGLEALRVLVTKLNLTCLHVDQVTGPSVGLPADHATSVHSLRELSVGGDVSVISGLFNLVRFPALRSAIIRLNSCTRTQFVPTDLTTFLALFFNAVDGDLQSFEFAVYTSAFQSHGNEPLLRDLLAPILPIHGLCSFSLFTSGSMVTIARIDDPDIQALAIAWPKLERLSIGSGFPSESSISISAIHYLYTHCTDLKELSISLFRFPVIGVHEIPAPLADHSPSHPLRHLSMQNTIIMKEILPLLGPELSGDGSEAIARYLLDLFPSLDPQQYKRAMEYLKSRPRRRLPSIMHFDHRWHNVLWHIYSICSERGEL